MLSQMQQNVRMQLRDLKFSLICYPNIPHPSPSRLFLTLLLSRTTLLDLQR